MSATFIVNVVRGSPTEMCFALGDWWLWGTMGFILICLTVRLFLELARLNDKINMATEIRRASGGWLACAGERLPLAVLK